MSYDLLAWKQRPGSELSPGVVYCLLADDVEVGDLEELDGDAVEALLDARFPSWRAPDGPFVYGFGRTDVSFQLTYSAVPSLLGKLTQALESLGLTVFDPQRSAPSPSEEKAARRIKRQTHDRELEAVRETELASVRARATAGDAKAQLELANKLALGDGVRKDPKEAVHWYRQAAEQGDADALFNLAACFQYGDGVQRDVDLAVRYYLAAAETDKTYAPFALGDIYLGCGPIARDNTKAEAYFSEALAHGHPDASAALRLVQEPNVTLELKKKAFKFWNPRD